MTQKNGACTSERANHAWKKPILFMLFSVLILGWVEGCRLARKKPPVIVDGKSYGVTQGPFRGTFWQYYERAGSYEKGELWSQAEEDLRKALVKNDHDKSRTRTYGMHFIDYFPNRELGVVLVSRGQYDTAITYLETSLSQEVTSKAQYYLDRARAMKIEKEQLDHNPPDVVIDSPADGDRLRDFTVTVKGTVRDDTYVKTVRINDRTLSQDLAAPERPFEQEVAVREGENTITVVAVDLSGKETRKTVTVYVDRTGPFLNIEEIRPDKTRGNLLKLKIYAGDDTGLKHIEINREPCPISPAREVILGASLGFPCRDGTVTMAVSDVLGNTTRARLACPGNPDTLALLTRGERLFASLDMPDMDASGANAPADDRGGGVTPESIRPSGQGGNNYALIVGINEYTDWTPLKTAVNDAREIKEVLVSRYGFAENHVTLLLDKAATKAAFFDAVMSLTAALGEGDNCLIYFAGHGQLSTHANDGYWIPVHGKRGNAIWSWIAHSAVRNLIVSEDVLAKNIMVIADSCYGGRLLRGGEAFSAQGRIAALAVKKSRQMISSGSLEPVADWGRDKHSLFSYYLLKGLRENQREMITLKSVILNEVWDPVFKNSGQRPVVGRFKTPMDEDGEFVLCLASNTGKTIPGNSIQTARSMAPGPRRDASAGDTLPPEITINDWKEHQVVSLDSVFIEGHVTDQSLIRDVTLNGRSVLKRRGKNIFFHRMEDLKPGDNTFMVVSTDVHGNTARRELHIVKKVNPVFCDSSRMTSVVFPVEVVGDRSVLKGFNIENILFDYLFDSCRFNLKNIRFSNADVAEAKFGKLSDDAAVADKARELGISFIIKSKAVLTESSVNLQVRIVETETLDVVSVTDLYQDEISRDTLLTACEGLVAKVCRDLPLVVGKVARIKGDDVLVNVGSGKGIKKGMHIVFFSQTEEIRDPDTGETLGMDVSEIGTARISRIQSKMSQADVLKLTEEQRLKVGLQVVTK